MILKSILACIHKYYKQAESTKEYNIYTQKQGQLKIKLDRFHRYSCNKNMKVTLLRELNMYSM